MSNLRRCYNLLKLPTRETSIPKLTLINKFTGEVFNSNNTKDCIVYIDYPYIFYCFKDRKNNQKYDNIIITCTQKQDKVLFSIELLNANHDHVIICGNTIIFKSTHAYYSRVVEVKKEEVNYAPHITLLGKPPYIRNSVIVHTNYSNNAWLKQASLLCACAQELGYTALTYRIFADNVKVDIVFTSAYLPHVLPFRSTDSDVLVGFIVCEGKLKKQHAEWIKKTFNFVFAVTNYAKKKLEEAGIEVLDVIPHGVDLETYKPWNIEKKYWFFYPVQRWSPRKLGEFYFFIEHMFKPSLFKRSEQYLPHIELIKLYNESWCLLSLSMAEGFNLPILEAMSCNLYVIANYHPSYDDYVPRECLVENAYVIDLEAHPYTNECYVPDMRKIIQRCREFIEEVKQGKYKGLRKHAMKFDYRIVYRRWIEKWIDYIVKHRR